MKPITAICIIVRDERNCILEWVAYHRSIGFDRVLIYDNESQDGTSDICRTLAQLGIVEYFAWPSRQELPGMTQILSYQNAGTISGLDWLCCLDADEFLVLEYADSIQDFVAISGRDKMPIALNWRIFGSSNAERANADFVIDRFQRCGPSEHLANAHIKTIAPVGILHEGAKVHVHGWLLGDNHHYVDACGGVINIEQNTFLRPPRWNCAWINHYIVKSKEEFKAKMKRGSVAKGEGDPEKYRINFDNYFQPYDVNDYENTVILRQRPKFIAEFERIGRLL